MARVRTIVSAAWLGMLLMAGPVYADGGAAAETAFTEGSALFDAGNFAQACPKLEAAVQLAGDSAIGGKLLLAQCWHKTNRYASAWGLYAEVQAKAEAAGNVERAEIARAGKNELTPLLHRVRLSSPDAKLAGFSLTQNGANFPIELLDSSVPIDAGSVTFHLEAKDRVALDHTIEVPATPGETVVTLPKLLPPPLSAKIEAPKAEGPSFWSAGRYAGLTIGLAGVVALGAGVVVGAVASSNYDAALVEGGCVAGSPPACRDVQPVESALSLGDAGTGVFFAGLGLAAAGVVIILVSPGEEPAVSAFSLHLAPTGAQALVRF